MRRPFIADGHLRSMRLAGDPVEIPARTGAAFQLKKGETLKVIDPCGEQVCDLAAFLASDLTEWLSAGRTIDYANRIYPMAGDVLYSNQSTPMLTIRKDTVGRHDFLLSPCSPEMFSKLYGITEPRPSCYGNLAKNLQEFGVAANSIPTTLNIFMNVTPDTKTGELTIATPLSRAGDYITFQAEDDLIVGLTACSAENSNNGTFKPIEFLVS